MVPWSITSTANSLKIAANSSMDLAMRTISSSRSFTNYKVVHIYTHVQIDIAYGFSRHIVVVVVVVVVVIVIVVVVVVVVY